MLSEVLHLLLHFLIIGCVAGFLSGLLGIGGGLFVVPALAYTFQEMGFPEESLMHMAVGSSFVIMVVTSARTMLSHMSYAIEFWDIFRRLVLGVVIGTLLGALVAHYLHSDTLSILFGIFVFLTAAQLAFFPDHLSGAELPGNTGMHMLGEAIGFLSGLLGVGGSAITIPALTYCNVSIRQAVVVSAAVSLTVSIMGTFSFALLGATLPDRPEWALGYVYFPAVFGVTIGSVLLVPIGVRVSHWLPVPTLKRIFAVFLVLVGIHMFANV